MKKQSKKVKTDTSKKRGRPPKKTQKQAKKKSEEKEEQSEQPIEEQSTETEEKQDGKSQTEIEQERRSLSENPTEQAASETELPKANGELLTQSQRQALRVRFSHLTENYFEGTKEEVLQRLVDTTQTNINELRTVLAAW